MLERTTSDNGDVPAATTVAAVQDLEWFLLSRLAISARCRTRGRCRSSSTTRLGVRGKGLDHLLGRLERISSAVQVVILSDTRDRAVGRVDRADRAVVLYPVPL